MKRFLAAVLVCAAGISLAPPARAAQDADYTVTVPFIFNETVIAADDALVMTQDDKRAYVWTRDGARALTIEDDEEFLDGGYIQVRLPGEKRWTVYRADGTRALAESYDEVILDGDVAFVANGTWRPPGVLDGHRAAFDLETGVQLVPALYDEIVLSADNKHLWARNWATAQARNDYRAFDRAGNDVTATVPYVALYEYENGWLRVCDPRTGLSGIVDEAGKLRVPVQYDEIDSRVLSGAALVRKGDKWGVSTIDGSGALLQPLQYYDAISYTNDLYALKRWNSIRADIGAGEPAVLYYGDGSPIPRPEGLNYVSVDDACGDVVLVREVWDGYAARTYLISTTGAKVLELGGKDYAAFGVGDRADQDFMIIAHDTNGNINDSITVNRWGEVIETVGSIASGGEFGRGLTLWSEAKGEVNLLADGRRLPNAPAGFYSEIDYNRGWILYRDENRANAWMTDLDGNDLIPKGAFHALDFASYFLVGGNYVKNRPMVTAQDKNGKYGALEVREAPYAYPPHDWAKAELDAAVSAGLVPEEQQRDWRDACTRADFCRLLAPLLDKANLESGETVSFSDTDDADVLRVASLGLVNGVGNGKFGPDRPISRQEAAAMLARAADALGVEATGAARSFTDADALADWARKAVDTVTRIEYGDGARVMQGVSDDRFEPHGLYTREQSILTILRLSRARG